MQPSKTVRYKLLDPRAKAPLYATPGAAAVSFASTVVAVMSASLCFAAACGGVGMSLSAESVEIRRRARRRPTRSR